MRSWEQYVGESWGARLASANRPIRLIVVVAALIALGFVSVELLGLSALVPAWLSWTVAVLALVLAYASPLAFLRRLRVQSSIRSVLEAAGLSFTGQPPVASPDAFGRWLDQNGLSMAEVRTVLVRDSASAD